MKLIAKKHFANVRSLGLAIDSKTEGFQHKDHVHRGHRFDVGTGEIFADLSSEHKELIGKLLDSRSVLLDNDENKAVVAKLDAEVKAERELAKKVAPKEATVTDILSALPGMIAAALKATPAAAGGK